MLAKLMRELNYLELGRVRDTLPNAVACTAYSRAIQILGDLHLLCASQFPSLLSEGSATSFALSLKFSSVAAQESLWAAFDDLWRLSGYPATASEYDCLTMIHRGELWSLDAFAEFLLGLDRIRLGRQFTVPVPPRFGVTLRGDQAPWRRSGELAGSSGETSKLIDSTDAAFAHISRLMDAAIRRGELPKPFSKGRVRVLPFGTLATWAKGPGGQPFEPAKPAHIVPSLELFGGSSAKWDIRPDIDAAAVVARRNDLRNLLARLIEDLGGFNQGIFTFIDLEPPKTLADLDGDRDEVQRIWPWAKVDKETFRGLVARLAFQHAELRAYHDVVEQIENEVFGGEDPLNPALRAQLNAALQQRDAAVEMWTLVSRNLLVYDPRDGCQWPPSLEDEATYARMRQELDLLLLGAHYRRPPHPG
jgi:hypothetical protein